MFSPLSLRSGDFVFVMCEKPHLKHRPTSRPSLPRRSGNPPASPFMWLREPACFPLLCGSGRPACFPLSRGSGEPAGFPLSCGSVNPPVFPLQGLRGTRRFSPSMGLREPACFPLLCGVPGTRRLSPFMWLRATRLFSPFKGSGEPAGFPLPCGSGRPACFPLSRGSGRPACFLLSRGSGGRFPAGKRPPASLMISPSRLREGAGGWVPPTTTFIIS